MLQHPGGSFVGRSFGTAGLVNSTIWLNTCTSKKCLFGVSAAVLRLLEGVESSSLDQT